MTIALTVLLIVCAVVLYTAWMNGVFHRCPHCRKIGSWRYDSAEPVTDEKDIDGNPVSSRQVRVCRKCGHQILDKWSDHEGRRLEKLESDGPAGRASTRKLEFSFNRLPVGIFAEPDYPRSPGRYRYMPYRGPGHYRMGEALARGPARCSFRDGLLRHDFIVIAVPEYGILQIDRIRKHL